MANCPKGQKHNDTVGACVPAKPEPYDNVIGNGGAEWYWDPNIDDWVKVADAPKPNSKTRDNVVYSQHNRDFL